MKAPLLQLRRAAILGGDPHPPTLLGWQDKARRQARKGRAAWGYLYHHPPPGSRPPLAQRIPLCALEVGTPSSWCKAAPQQDAGQPLSPQLDTPEPSTTCTVRHSSWQPVSPSGLGFPSGQGNHLERPPSATQLVCLGQEHKGPGAGQGSPQGETLLAPISYHPSLPQPQTFPPLSHYSGSLIREQDISGRSIL